MICSVLLSCCEWTMKNGKRTFCSFVSFSPSIWDCCFGLRFKKRMVFFQSERRIKNEKSGVHKGLVTGVSLSLSLFFSNKNVTNFNEFVQKLQFGSTRKAEFLYKFFIKTICVSEIGWAKIQQKNYFCKFWRLKMFHNQNKVSNVKMMHIICCAALLMLLYILQYM